MKKYKYIAFISYNHADKSIAKKLQQKIYNFRLPAKLREEYPDLPAKVGNVFRDDTHLTSGDLSHALEDALDNSKFLIVVCSKETFESGWVKKEIEYFKGLGQEKYIIPYIVDTTINVEEYLSDVDLDQQLAIVSGPLSVNKLIACLVGIDLITLTKCIEDVSASRRRLQRYIIACIVLMLLGLSYLAYIKYRDYKVSQLEKLIEQIEHSVDVADFGAARSYAIDAYDNYKDYLKNELRVDYERVVRKVDLSEQFSNWMIIGDDFSQIKKVEFSNDGDSILVFEKGISDNYLRTIWDISKNKCLSREFAEKNFVNEDEYPQWAQDVASYSLDADKALIAADFKRCYPDAQGADCIKMYEVGNYKLFVTSNYGILIYDELSKKNLNQIHLASGIVDVAYSEESSMIAVATISKIYLSYIGGWFPRFITKDKFELISISPDGKYVLLNCIGDDGKYISVWDIEENSEYSRLYDEDYIFADIYSEQYCIIYYPDKVTVVGLDLKTICCESVGDIDGGSAFVFKTYFPDESLVQLTNKIYEVHTFELLDSLKGLTDTFAPKYQCLVEGESSPIKPEIDPQIKLTYWVDREDFPVSVYEMNSRELKGEFNVCDVVRDVAVNSSGDIAVLAGDKLYVSNLSDLDDVKSCNYSHLYSDIERFGDYFTITSESNTVVVDNVYGKEVINLFHPVNSRLMLDFTLGGESFVMANGYQVFMFKFKPLDDIIKQWR